MVVPSAVAVVDNRNRVRALVPFDSFARFGRLDNGSNTVVEKDDVCVSRAIHCELNYVHNAAGQPVLHVSDFSTTGTWVGHGEAESSEVLQKLSSSSGTSTGMWRVRGQPVPGGCMLRLMLGDAHSNRFFRVVNADDGFYRACVEGDSSRAAAMYHAKTPLIGVAVSPYIGANSRISLLRSAVRNHSIWLIAKCLHRAVGGGQDSVDVCADFGDIVDAMRHAPLRVFVMLYKFWVQHKYAAAGNHDGMADFKARCLVLAVHENHYHNTAFLCREGAPITEAAVAAAKGCSLPMRLALMVASPSARQTLNPSLAAGGACSTMIVLGALGMQPGMQSLTKTCIADGRLTVCGDFGCQCCKTAMQAAAKSSGALLNVVATKYYGCPKTPVQPAFAPHMFFGPAVVRPQFARKHFHLDDYAGTSCTMAMLYIARLVKGRGLWARENHAMFSSVARETVKTVLLLQARAHLVVAGKTYAATCVLPMELWTAIIFPFLKHGDWQVG